MPLPLGYNANARCESCSEAPKHTVENHKDLKYKVHDLIDSKVISFTPNGPNVNNNLMPSHVGPSVSVIEEYEGQNLVSRVDEMKTSLAMVKEQLLKNDVFPGCQSGCEQCLSNTQMCKKLKFGVQ